MSYRGQLVSPSSQWPWQVSRTAGPERAEPDDIQRRNFGSVNLKRKVMLSPA